MLLAAGAGAGLATAFNAPIAGAVFVLEELVQKFEHRIAVAALAASATAIAVARLLLGDAPDFQVGPVSLCKRSRSLPLFLVLGAIAGLLAVAYNRALLATMARPSDLAACRSRLAPGRSARPSASSPGSRPNWSAAATRSRSAR